MRNVMTAGLFSLSLLATGAVAEEAKHRQLGPHVHGQGTLDLAIEGNKIQMELVSPGMDIVGFEHVASTPEQKVAIEKAKLELANVLAVFKLPAAADCKVDNATVENRAEVHKPGEKDDDDDDKPGAPQHSEFHATYSITCAAPERLTSMETTYFSQFSGGHLLDVNVTTSKGQTQAQLTREKATLDLSGIM